MKKRAFTLAEVLITLGIIGIVAALTIPSLIANNQKESYMATLKKTYALVNQAFLQMSVDDGSTGDLRTFFTEPGQTTYVHTQYIGDKMVPYFKVLKNCQQVQPPSCWASKEATYFDGSSVTTTAWEKSGAYTFILQDGVSISLDNFLVSCKGSVGGVDPACSNQFAIDVNGPKKPNTVGRDIFFFIVSPKGPFLYPYGGQKAGNWKGSHFCDFPITNNARSKEGLCCAGRVMESGWQMDY